jgi:hypothetical protein
MENDNWLFEIPKIFDILLVYLAYTFFSLFR